MLFSRPWWLWFYFCWGSSSAGWYLGPVNRVFTWGFASPTLHPYHLLDVVWCSYPGGKPSPPPVAYIRPIQAAQDPCQALPGGTLRVLGILTGSLTSSFPCHWFIDRGTHELKSIPFLTDSGQAAEIQSGKHCLQDQCPMPVAIFNSPAKGQTQQKQINSCLSQS